MNYREKLESVLRPTDDEIDKDRLGQLAGELDPKRKDDSRFLESLGHDLESLGYHFNIFFGTWIKRPKGSGIRRLLASIWR